MSVSDVVALHVSVISLDHPQGHCSYAMLLSASGFRHNFSWGCGCIFCLCCCVVCLTAARLVVYCIQQGGEWSASCPGRTLPPGKTGYPLYRRMGGPQGRSGQVRIISPPTGIRSPDRPARSQLLYRLHYPAHQVVFYSHVIYSTNREALPENYKYQSRLQPKMWRPKKEITPLQC
jgi:hypothetical protein